MNLEKILEVFEFLSNPFEDAVSKDKSAGKTPEAVIKNITDYCLAHVELLEESKHLLNKTTEYSSWKITCVILSALSKLKDAVEQTELEQTEEEKSIDVLSIQSRIIIQKSVELVVGFGIVPYLLPGLGVPEKLRKRNPHVLSFLSDVKAASPYDQYLRLSHTLEVLLICSSHSSLNALILSNYSTDILSGLLQICKSSITPPKANVAEQKPGMLSVQQYDHVMLIRKKMRLLMTSTFLVTVPKSSLVNSIFLIGSAEKQRWIVNACNELLYSIILSKNGLISLATTLLESSNSSDTWKLTRVISGLMRNAVMKCSDPATEDIRSFADQCYHMVKQNQVIQEKCIPFCENADVNLSNNPKSISAFNSLPYGTNTELVRIGLFCGLTLMDINYQLGKAAFWDKLFCSVLVLDKCQNSSNFELLGDTNREPNCNEPFVSIQNLGMCITYSELLLSFVKPMSISVPLELLQPVWSLFFQIFVACERYLKKPVQEPNVAAVAEQLHHKLRDVLISLFEIYGSGSGQNFALPSNIKSTPSANPSVSKSNTLLQPKENVDLCQFCMMLLLNQQPHTSPVLNTFDLQFDARIVRFYQEVVSSSSNYNEVFDNYLNTSCHSLSNEILKNERLKGIWPVLFRQLLAWGTKASKFAGAFEPKTFKSDNLPTHIGGDAVTVCLSDCQRFITFKLLGELGDEEAILEQFGESESVEETLSFLELLLNKFTNEACANLNEAFDTSQLVMYALGIIGALSEAASLSSTKASNDSFSAQSVLPLDKEIGNIWTSLEIFIPHLRKLSQCTQSSLVRQGVPEMARNLIITIGTRGSSSRSCKASNEILKTRFQQAMEDASNPMIHVKGHGILELRRLLQARDAEALENDGEILKVFKYNLQNEDSYVYLMTIQGLSTFGLKFHKTVVPLLIQEYDFASNSEQGERTEEKVYEKYENEERTEMRMKIGEILVQVVQKLGEFAPSYRVPLTNVFFRLVRDEEPLIRASALSNLGELCHLLRFTLSVILTEVWYCVESILTTEKNPQVRRAALHLIVLLLKGVAKDLSADDIVGDTVVSRYLRDVRRFLTTVEQTERDLVAKTHCQLAIQELEFIVKKILTPNHSLNYKIQVLNL